MMTGPTPLPDSLRLLINDSNEAFLQSASESGPAAENTIDGDQHSLAGVTSVSLNSLSAPLTLPSAMREVTPCFLRPEAPRVSYSLSPDAGLARIVDDSSQAQVNSTAAAPVRPTPGPFKRTRRLLTPLAPPQKQGHKVTLTHVLGPDTGLAEHLHALPNEWQDKHPGAFPTFAARIRANHVHGWPAFKVFGRDGDQYEITIYSVEVKPANKGRGARYLVMILHIEGAPDQFVGFSACRPGVTTTDALSKDLFGAYLIAWDGAKGKWEDEVVAIRVWFRNEHDPKDLPFRASMFDNAVGKIEPFRITQSKPKQEVNDAVDIDMDLVTPQPRSSKRRVHVDSTGSPLSSVPCNDEPLPLLYNPEVRIKLSASGTVRCFPLEGCDISTLFKKAEQFYGSMKVPWTKDLGLTCKIPDAEEIRFIGEGCADEWEILYKDVRTATMCKDGIQLVEVYPAGA